MIITDVEVKAKGFFSEFVAFAAKGNALDLAFGVVLGAAFGAIVNSLVTDIVTPFLSLATRNVNFNAWEYPLRKAVENPDGTISPAVVVNYGHLLQTTINFIVVAFCIFLFVKVIARIRARIKLEEEKGATASLSTQELLLTEIRDTLREQKMTSKGPQENIPTL